MGKIWIVKWDTESCDHGIAGPWLEEPSEEILEVFFKEEMPDEFEDGDCYISWTVCEIDLTTIKPSMCFM